MSRLLLRPFRGFNFNLRDSGLRLMAKSAQASKVRLSPTEFLKKHKIEPPKYKNTEHEFRISKKASVETVQSLLDVRTVEALKIVSTKKELRKVTSVRMKTNHSVLSQAGVISGTFAIYPELLAVPEIEEKLQLIRQLNYNINTVAVLFLLPVKILRKLVHSEVEVTKELGKITRFMELLQIDEKEACACFTEKPFLVSLPIEKIESSVKLLTDYGVDHKEIRSDLCVLKYSTETISDRLRNARDHKIEIIKTWMVRAQPGIFQTYIKRRSDNKSILGEHSLAEYLSERLECSLDMANYIILKYPPLNNKSLKKLNELIDLLLAEGFQPSHICRVPKILVHSVQTTRNRLKQLEEKHIQLDSLHMLTKSQKQFTHFYELLVKSNKK